MVTNVRVQAEAKSWRPLRLRRVLWVVRLAITVALGFVALLLVVYRSANPPGSTLMAYETLAGRDIAHRWVPLSAISPQLVRAVIAAEDAHFCRHNGVDWAAIGEAIDRAGEDGPRGASTISMQTVKNLFLWSSRSYVRKALEVPLTYVSELTWSKRRILEIYLNIAEWGPGVYGAEAAARYHFGKSAARLTADEAALLAATLPDPQGRDAGDPGRTTTRVAGVIRKRMEAASVRCVLG
jgi:monofunctional biosynthetic peptidoglycan transglycosylase